MSVRKARAEQSLYSSALWRVEETTPPVGGLNKCGGKQCANNTAIGESVEAEQCRKLVDDRPRSAERRHTTCFRHAGLRQARIQEQEREITSVRQQNADLRHAVQALQDQAAAFKAENNALRHSLEMRRRALRRGSDGHHLQGRQG